MSTRSDGDGDRRRSPRFSCGGLATIRCIPSDGVLIPGKLRDLSLHGCCVDTALPVEYGVRAEIVVRVNAASFRALGEVRVIRGSAGAGLEFIQLSSGGRDLLQDLVTDLAKVQALTNDLKLDRRETGADLRRKLADGKRTASNLSARVPLDRIVTPVTTTEGSTQQRSRENVEGRIETGPRLVITVDLFG